VRFALARMHTSIQVQRGIPAFPAQGSQLARKVELIQRSAAIVFTFVSRSVGATNSCAKFAAADAQVRGTKAPVASHQGAGALARLVRCPVALRWRRAVRPLRPALRRAGRHCWPEMNRLLFLLGGGGSRCGAVPSLVASCAPLLTPFCASRASFLTPFCTPRSPFLTPLGTRLRRICGRRRGRGGRRGGLGFSP
jgi:hypothetical protein